MICINKPPDVLFVRRLGVIADRLHFQRDSTSGLMEEVEGNGRSHQVRDNDQSKDGYIARMEGLDKLW
jgi:hypothetical protein